MKKTSLTRIVALTGAAVLAIGALAGCGKTAETSEVLENAEEVVAVPIADEMVAKADTVSSAPYFTKGVYVNYAEGATTRDYFYVFYDEGAGYTEDANTGTGLPFSCQQEDGKVTFSFGGEDGINDVFTVTSRENGIITGSFEDGLELHFELKEDADPDNFNSNLYVNPGTTEDVYASAYGWKVKYNPQLFTINEANNYVSFVYMGESAGTNMIEFSYEINKGGKQAVDDVAECWGSDNVMKTEGLFPGTENVDGYWAVLPPAEDGTGMYQTAIARDYMDGYLLIEMIGHNSGDDEMDMAVSDAMAMIVDSLEFPYQD